MQQVQRATENYDANVGETVETIGKIILISTWAFEVHKYWIWGNTKKWNVNFWKNMMKDL